MLVLLVLVSALCYPLLNQGFGLLAHRLRVLMCVFLRFGRPGFRASHGDLRCSCTFGMLSTAWLSSERPGREPPSVFTHVG